MNNRVYEVYGYVSKFLKMPNGKFRKCRVYDSGSAVYVVHANKTQRSISGLCVTRGNVEYFVPQKQEDHDFLKTVSYQRDTYNAPKTREELMERLNAKSKALRNKNIQLYGPEVSYRGEIRSFNYTRKSEPFGFISLNGTTLKGFNREGIFRPVKQKDADGERNFTREYEKKIQEDNADKFGAEVLFEGVKRKIRYRNARKPYGEINFGGEKIYGKNVDGTFVPFERR